MNTNYLATLVVASIGWLAYQSIDHVTKVEKERIKYNAYYNYLSKQHGFNSRLTNKPALNSVTTQKPINNAPKPVNKTPKIVTPTKETGVGDKYFIEIRGLNDVTKVNFSDEDIEDDDKLPYYTEEEIKAGKPFIHKD